MSNDSKKTTYSDTIGVPEISISASHKVLIPILESGHVPCLHGEAGIGKTESCVQIADAMGISRKHVVTIPVPQKVASDFTIPFRDGDSQFFVSLLGVMFRPIVEAASQGAPSMIFLDEITRYQDQETASMLFSILTDRRIGEFDLPDNCYIMAACNPPTGDYEVNDVMSDLAWRRRLNHIVVKHDVSGWLRWAKDSEVHPWVIDYISSNPDALLDERAAKAGKVYATPATWAKVSKLIKASGGDLNVVALASYLNYDVAADFVSFTQDSEFKLPPSVVLSDASATKEVLDRMEKAGRGDLVSRLVTAVAIYCYNEQPDVSVAAKNLCSFWAKIGAETKVKLATELLSRKVDGEAYYRLLMKEVAGNPLWRTEIYPEVRHCMES